jgi:hypothetical protein
MPLGAPELMRDTGCSVVGTLYSVLCARYQCSVLSAQSRLGVGGGSTVAAR